MKKLISLVSLFCLSVFLPLSVMGEPIDPGGRCQAASRVYDRDASEKSGTSR